MSTCCRVTSSPHAVMVDEPTPERIVDRLRADARPGHVALVLMGAKHTCDFAAYEALDDVPEHVVGLFPGIINGHRVHRRGALVMHVPALAAPQVVDLAEPAVSDDLVRRMTEAEDRPTLMVFADGTAEHTGRLMEMLNDRFGSTCSFVGGGAGRLDAPGAPCLIAGGQAQSGIAVLVPVNASSTVCARHGWTRSGAPIVATRTRGNVIEHLNWEPAFEVYQRAVKERTGAAPDRTSLALEGISSPFGLVRSRDEDVVRIPRSVTETGGIRCSGPVPRHALLHLMEGHQETLEDAARQARRMVEDGTSTPLVFVACCASRSSVSPDDHGTELDLTDDTWTDSASRTAGVLTLGEIGSMGYGSLEWLNNSYLAASLSHRALDA